MDRISFLKKALLGGAAVALGSPSVASGSTLASGTELDYVETAQGTFNVPVGDPGQGNTTLWLQGKPVSYDGATRICVEAYCAAMEPDFNQSIVMNVYEGTTNLGSIVDSSTGETSGNITRDATTGYGRYFFTPPSGTHAYSIRIWSTGGRLNRVYSGLGGEQGGSPTWLPSYLRITVA